VTDFLNVSGGDRIELYCYSFNGNTNSEVFTASINAIQLNSIQSKVIGTKQTIHPKKRP